MVVVSDAAKISLAMPGARADRELTAELAVNRADPEMTLRLRSPWKKLDLAGGYLLFIFYVIFSQEYSISAHHCSPWGSCSRRWRRWTLVGIVFK